MLSKTEAAALICAGKATLGIEFGSTRIKAVLIDPQFRVLASGAYEWENRLEDGWWTYPLSEVTEGMQACFAELASAVQSSYGVFPATLRAIGVSGMMHGYLAFSDKDELLVPFRTWRNTATGEAAGALSRAFDFHIPQRWSVAHLYQAVLKKEAHLPRVAWMTTLSGYVFRLLTGKHALGAGDASGMFPLNAEGSDYRKDLLEIFDSLCAGSGLAPLKSLLPSVLPCGSRAGELTREGALLLDPTGRLCPGIPLCPPEGDCGTGLVATGTLARGSGNISAGTSIFAGILPEKPLMNAYEEIDIAAAPDGKPLAMVHGTNCTGELDAWIDFAGGLLSKNNCSPDKSSLYRLFYRLALAGEDDCGGLVAYNYLSGEHMTNIETGRPLFFRTRPGGFTPENFARCQLYAAFAPLAIGMRLLTQKEGVHLHSISAHGGMFKDPEAPQRILASALGIPVSVSSTAGEGGPWGMAVLASYFADGAPEPLESYVSGRVFAGQESTVRYPEDSVARGFSAFLTRYEAGLPAERLLKDVK